MIQVATAVKHDGRDASFNSFLANDCAEFLSAFNVGTVLASSLEVGAQGGNAQKRFVLGVIDELNVNIRVAAGHAQTRTSCSAGNLAANTTMATTQTGLLFLKFIHDNPFNQIPLCVSPCQLCRPYDVHSRLRSEYPCPCKAQAYAICEC